MNQEEFSFFLGILAGEGSVGIRYQDKSVGAPSVQPFATVKMMNEKELMDRILEITGIGNVYSKKNNMYQWQAWEMNQCKQLISLIDRNMSDFFRLSNKFDSYCRWKDCIRFVEERKHRTPEGLEKLMEMSSKINGEHFTSKEELIDRYYEEPMMDLSDLDANPER